MTEKAVEKKTRTRKAATPAPTCSDDPNINAGDIIGAWIDWHKRTYTVSPVSTVIGIASRHVKELVIAGYPSTAIRYGLFQWDEANRAAVRTVSPTRIAEHARQWLSRSNSEITKRVKQSSELINNLAVPDELTDWAAENPARIPTYYVLKMVTASTRKKYTLEQAETWAEVFKDRTLDELYEATVSFLESGDSFPEPGKIIARAKTLRGQRLKRHTGKLPDPPHGLTTAQHMAWMAAARDKIGAPPAVNRLELERLYGSPTATNTITIEGTTSRAIEQ